jgi:hypothetical protein
MEVPGQTTDRPKKKLADIMVVVNLSSNKCPSKGKRLKVQVKCEPIREVHQLLSPLGRIPHQ